MEIGKIEFANANNIDIYSNDDLFDLIVELQEKVNQLIEERNERQK